jgi:hypothetical protein
MNQNRALIEIPAFVFCLLIGDDLDQQVWLLLFFTWQGLPDLWVLQ